ncbi:MAG TPA: hypothetical protein VME66_15470 [Candidatus Acidoferrales bacterium]|nr:hypothetical protein [Candidatus Acidoferrales bacterium]
MSAHIGAVALRIEAPASRRADGERVARELRATLADALRGALAEQTAVPGVAIVPRMHVTLRAPLGRVRGRDLARTIAQACIDTIVAQSVTLGSSATDHSEGTAERTLRALDVLEGVRVDHAVEAATWLIALAQDRRCVLRRASPFVDLEPLPTPAALVAICERCDADEVVAALGLGWTRLFARRCTASEARRLLALLDDGLEPSAQTWHFLVNALDAADNARGASSPPADVQALLGAIEAIFAHLPGAVAAARILAHRATTRVQSALVAQTATVSREDKTLACACAGFWLLLPHLAPRIANFEGREAAAIALALAQLLFGESASDDPAIVALCDGEDREKLHALVPADLRLERLAVRVVRSFARTLMRFERARCTYVVRTFLTGSSAMRRTPDGWAARLPNAPLRLILERAALTGTYVVPWNGVQLAIEPPE